MKSILLVILCTFAALSASAQDWGWWNDLVQWDGKTPWKKYLQLSTSGLGPNALPVPEFHSQGITKGFRFTNKIRYHHFSEDPTLDHFAKLDYGFNDQVGISVWMVTAEYYNTSIELRNKRKLREFSPKGWTSGDLYFSTYFYLLREQLSRPSVMISATIKTASGNNLEGGRVTDTPGYYFNANVSKKFGNLNPYFVAGLYVYQTFDGLHFQNDAFLYGIGNVFNMAKHSIKLEWAGYYGYLDIGDKPSVLRLDFDFKVKENHTLTIGSQIGINDLDYNTISVGYNYFYKN